MNYIHADKQKATKAGFSPTIHNVLRGGLVLTEKELLLAPSLSGSLADRLKTVGGKVVSLNWLKGG